MLERFVVLHRYLRTLADDVKEVKEKLPIQDFVQIMELTKVLGKFFVDFIDFYLIDLMIL